MAKNMAPVEQEPAYTARELEEAHAAFGVPKELVCAALKHSGAQSATEAEARDLIAKFCRTEVK